MQDKNIIFRENVRILFKVMLIWNLVLTILLLCVTISHVNFQKRFYIPPVQEYQVDIDNIELEPVEVEEWQGI